MHKSIYILKLFKSGHPRLFNKYVNSKKAHGQIHCLNRTRNGIHYVVNSKRAQLQQLGPFIISVYITSRGQYLFSSL